MNDEMPDSVRESLAVTMIGVQDHIRAIVSEAYKAGYDAGVVAGSQHMRDAILRAAQMPIAAPTAVADHHRQSAEPPSRPSSDGRAPRGSVRRAVTIALRESPGLTEQELGAAAQKIDPSVSARSVGGEIRRLKDRLYQNDGGRWFLITEVGDEETAEAEASAAALEQEAHMEPP